MNVMLLAAGEGTRLRPHTTILPKPAIPFLNVPLAAYALSFLESQDIQKLVTNTFHLPELMENSIKQLAPPVEELIFSREFPEILGSGGGLKRAEVHFTGGGDFAMMNADEVILPEDPLILQKALQAHKANNALATLFVMQHEGVGTQFGGVWANESDVLGFGKEPVARSQQAWHFIGTQILNEKIFSYLPENTSSNILYDGLSKAIAAGEKVQIFPILCRWFETGNEKDFLQATQTCLEFIASDSSDGKYLKKIHAQYGREKFVLRKGVDHTAYFAQSVHISEKANLQGFVVAGPGTTISTGCQLKNVSLAGNLKLPAQIRLENRILLSL